ncbi:MAG: NAD(P)-dependent oxidoreductase [Gammaproteobacteria bacterium]
MRVAFIGIGNMGSPMAGHIVKGGHDVTVYDSDADRVSRFASSNGCRGARTPADLRDSELVITMLPDGHAVRSVMRGEAGLAPHLKHGALFIDMSSSDPVGTRTLGAELATLGIVMLDAPVSGAVPRATLGTLAIMIGGDDKPAIERARPILSLMGDRLFETGGLGSGHAMKSLNNYIAAATFAASAEALLIGQRFGLDPATMFDIINVSTGRSFISEVVMKEHVITGKFATGFTVGLLAKDVRIAADLGEAMNLDAPVLRLVRDRWALARDRLGATRDNAEAVKSWDEDLKDS